MATRSETPRCAGLFRQLAAIVYDSLLVIALWFAVGALMLLLSGGRLSAPDRPDWLLMLFQGTLLFTTWLFFAWFWTHGGQTLGMRAWRLKLVGRHGEPVSWTQTIVRFVAALVSAAVLGLGYLWAVIDPEHCRWHDRLSGTRLVLVPKSGSGTSVSGAVAKTQAPQ
jgi:uncharacterized RDD family membrane protein YckC